MPLPISGTYIYGIAVSLPRTYLRCQPIIVLVKEGLSYGAEVQPLRRRLVRQFVASKCLEFGQELLGLDELEA